MCRHGFLAEQAAFPRLPAEETPLQMPWPEQQWDQNSRLPTHRQVKPGIALLHLSVLMSHVRPISARFSARTCCCLKGSPCSTAALPDQNNANARTLHASLPPWPFLSCSRGGNTTREFFHRRASIVPGDRPKADTRNGDAVLRLSRSRVAPVRLVGPGPELWTGRGAEDPVEGCSEQQQSSEETTLILVEAQHICYPSRSCHS